MCHRVAAFRSQCQWARIFISLTTPMAMGTLNLDLNGIERVIPENWFPEYYQ